MRRFRFTFRLKLLLIFVFLAIIPLVFLSSFSYFRVKQSYQETLMESFTRNAQIKQQILTYFIDFNLSWIKSLASQDILLAALENPKDKQGYEKVFASLMSVRRENPYIERAYILNPEGEVLISTATNDVGSKLGQVSFVTEPLKNRSSYVGRIIISPYGKRIIPFSTPLIRKSDNKPIGILVIDFNTSIIKALFENRLYSKNLYPITSESEIESYVVDNDGLPLSELKYGQKEKNLLVIKPVVECLNNTKDINGIYDSYFGQKVLGVSKCLKIDGITWTLVVEEPVNQVFSVSQQLGMIIFIATILVILAILFIYYPVSKSFTQPMTLLTNGAKILGAGNLDYRINIKTGDELETLANSFNDMAGKLANLVNDLKKEKEILQIQKIRLDQSAKLLLRRDMDLQEANEEMEKEKELAEAEKNKFKIVLEGISDGLIATNLDRKIVTINRAAEKILGYKPYEVIDKYIYEVLSLWDENGKEVRVDDYCPLKKDDFEGIVFSKSNLKLSGKNNKESYVNLISGKIKEGQAIKLGMILTFHDVTEEQELEKMKLDFVSIAAHELRAPLTTVLGYLSFLSKPETLAKLNDYEKEFLARATLSSTNLNKLIENLLAVSKIEQGRMIIEPNEIDLSIIINKTVNSFQDIAKNKGLILQYLQPQKSLPLVIADPDRIEEVLANLINNALNYTEQGKITISVHQEGPFLVTAVSDSGKGIPQEAMTHLFTKFFRVKGKLEAGSKGTGLGLYISKNIITAHKGKIWVESQLGIGSTFYFSLPIAYPKKDDYN
jgi:PAS domain S-box-containing protein